jgi:hypothetical protein
MELLFSLGGAELIERGRTKVALRRALGDLLPPVVRDRVDKLGFVTPEATWFRNGLGDLGADVFASQSFRERGFVNAGAARRRLEQHQSGERTAGNELWRALCVELGARVPLAPGSDEDGLAACEASSGVDALDADELEARGSTARVRARQRDSSGPPQLDGPPPPRRGDRQP